ncbi:MAG: pyridoxamine 5'-phosphate oxidase family protein [Candidatus Scalinduaceae bacterium]
MSDVKTKIRDYLDSVKTVSVATCMDDKPSCRIMELQKVEDDLKIWFVAHQSFPKIEHINKNSNACIVSFNNETSRDIRLFGKVEVYADMETKKCVWKDDLAPYFQGGINDPELIVLKFIPERLEFRDMKTGSLLPEVENL